MNAALERLLAEGWQLEDVLEDEAEREAAAEPPGEEPEQAVPTPSPIQRKGDSVVVDASEDVTPDEAATLLSNVEGCTELVLTEAARYRAPWHQTVHAWCEALSKLGSQSLERFIVDTEYQPLTRQASVYCGDLTDLFRGCPKLRFAFVIGCAELRALAHEQLEDLTIMAEPLTVSTLDAVLTGPCPRLRRLALGLAYEGFQADGADAALLAGLGSGKLSALNELYIAYPQDGGALLEGLLTLPIVARLRVLYVEGNVFDDEERVVALLREQRARLSHLEALYLPVQDAMDHDDALLAEICPVLRSVDDLKPFSLRRQ